MDSLRNNLMLITSLKNYPQIYQNLTFKNDTLYINTNGKIIEINLKNINLAEVFNDNFKRNLFTLSVDDFGKILEIESKKNEVLPPKALEEEKKSNPRIKNFKVLKKFREDGSYLEYPYYIDEYGNIKVLFNYAGTNILSSYQKLFVELAGDVTAKDLYDFLDRKMKNISLQPDYTLPSDSLREGVKLETEIINKQSGSDRLFVNDEHGLYKTGNNLYTFNANENGLNKNTIDNDVDKEEVATYNDKFDEKGIYVEADSSLEASIISEDEYYMLISYAEPSEKPEIGLFESYIEDVIKYESYLSPKLQALLSRYRNKMMVFEMSQTANPYENQALIRYKEILNKEENLKSSLEKDNVLIRVRKLEQQYDKAGFTFINIILISTAITFLLTIFLLIKH